MKDTFTLVELKRIIQSLPKHTIEFKTPPHIDGNLDVEMECFEEKMFWYRLLGSDWERKRIRNFETFTTSSIIKRIRNIYSKFMNIELFDMSGSNDYDIIWEGGLLTDEKYKQFIKKLEDEFGISILDEVWNDEDGFKDLTDDKYRTFNGLGEYIYSQTNF